MKSKEAQVLRGNWKNFNSFIWFREKELPDAENWALVYTHTGSSGLRELVNHLVMEEKLASYIDAGEDIFVEDDNHWACGFIKGFAIRVYQNDDGRTLTEAFSEYVKLHKKLKKNGGRLTVLDKKLHTKLTKKRTLEYVEEACRFVADELPEDNKWVKSVYNYLLKNYPKELESEDDLGGYPSKEAATNALVQLGFITLAEIV